MSEDTKNRLRGDLAAIAKDAEEMFAGSGENLAERAKEIRDRLADVLAATDKTIKRLDGGAATSTGGIGELIREKPYHAVGLAVGVGLIIGLLLKRK